MTAGLPKRVIILGGSGFIGSALTARLKLDGEIPVEAWSSSYCNLLDPASPDRLLCDVNSETTLIFTSVVGRLQDNSMEAMRKNYEMARNCLAALSDRQLRSIIFLSTADVYGLPPRELPITERTAPCPVDWYGWSKLLTEALFQRFEQRCPIAVLRLPGVYGPGDKGRSVIGGLVRRMHAGVPVSLTSRGAVRRDYLEVSDLCEIIIRTVQVPWNGVLNAVSGQAVSIAELAQTVATTVAVDLNSLPRVEAVSTVGDRDYDVVFDDTARISRFPELRPRRISEGISFYVAALRQQTGDRQESTL